MVSKHYEMGYTPAEFKKTLQGQFTSKTQYLYQEPSANKKSSTKNWIISSKNGSFTIDIKIKEAPPRKIAMLTLPVLNTSFQFNNASDLQQEEFLKTFFKYFHKGGG